MEPTLSTTTSSHCPCVKLVWQALRPIREKSTSHINATVKVELKKLFYKSIKLDAQYNVEAPSSSGDEETDTDEVVLITSMHDPLFKLNDAREQYLKPVVKHVGGDTPAVNICHAFFDKRDGKYYFPSKRLEDTVDAVIKALVKVGAEDDPAVPTLAMYAFVMCAFESLCMDQPRIKKKRGVDEDDVDEAPALVEAPMVDWTEWSKEVKVRLNWMSNSTFCPTRCAPHPHPHLHHHRTHATYPHSPYRVARQEEVLAHQRKHAYATPAKKSKGKENTPATKQTKKLQTASTSASTADMRNWQRMDVWHGRSAARATCLRRRRRRGGRGGQGSGTWQMLVTMEVAMARRAHVDFFAAHR